METIHVDNHSTTRHDDTTDHLLSAEKLAQLMGSMCFPKTTKQDLYPLDEKNEVTQIPKPLPYLLLPCELNQELEQAKQKRRIRRVVQAAAWLLSLLMLSLFGLAIALPCFLLAARENPIPSTLSGILEQKTKELRTTTEPSLLMSVETSSKTEQAINTYRLGTYDYPSLLTFACGVKGKNGFEAYKMIRKLNPAVKNWERYFHTGEEFKIPQGCKLNPEKLKKARQEVKKLRRTNQGGSA